MSRLGQGDVSLCPKWDREKRPPVPVPLDEPTPQWYSLTNGEI